MTKAKSATIQNNRYRNKKLIAGGGELEFNENGQCTCDPDLAERLSNMKGFSIVDTVAAAKAEKAAKAKAAKEAKAEAEGTTGEEATE